MRRLTRPEQRALIALSTGDWCLGGAADDVLVADGDMK